MGPLANPRRVATMEALIADAVQKGAEVRTSGKRIGNKGNFFGLLATLDEADPVTGQPAFLKSCR